MLSQEVEEQLAERLVNRIEETNAKVLTKIGEAIKQISTLNPSQAYQLSQILKYGGSYEEIAKELAKVSGKNVQDIYKIFDEVAKNNKQFAKEFYKYRGIDYIPYKDDIALQNQVRSIASITAGTYMNIANTSAVGLVLGGDFVPLQQAYTGLIDKAIVSVMQGKETFYTSMRDILKELGSNGLVQYQSGRTRRLDSAVRMNMLDGIRQLNKETTLRFGEEYNADGVEISVHSNPAPDHADIQGRQFSKDEFEKLEAGDTAKDIKGNIYDGSDKRQIGEYNCYHKIFNIVLGVSKPEYTDEQLEKIKEDNEKGFEYEGKHYTNYEGTQIQRRIETEIRRQKDTQILAKASGDMELVGESQRKITILTHKYNDLCKASGLKPKKQRMTVSGYVRTKVNNINYIKDNDALKILENNHKEWWKELTEIEKKDILRYTGGTNVDINYYLNEKQRVLGINAQKEITEISKESIPIIDKALSKFKRNENIIVYRTSKINDIFENGIDFNNIKNYKNTIISHKGYMSTSALKEGTKNIKGDAFIEYKVPKEIQGAYLGKQSLIPEEYEFLIGRGVEYNIDDIYVENKKVYIKATIIKQKRSKV